MVADGKAIAQPIPDPVKAGYNFAGWYSDKNLTSIYDFRKIVVKDIALYAKWDAKVSPSALYFDYNYKNAPNPPAAISTTYGAALSNLPVVPIFLRKGYKFMGWKIDGDTKVLTSKTIWDKDITHAVAKAQWAASYTLTFNSKGGSAVEAQNVAKTELPVQPKVPTRSDGLIFAGWYVDEIPVSTSKPFDFSVPLAGDTTVYAGWFRLFDDVKNPKDWFYNSVYAGAFKGYMKGRDDANLFEPYVNTTREMVATVLHRLRKVPTPSGDVEKILSDNYRDSSNISDWAREAVAWCTETGVYTGYIQEEGKAIFAPQENVSREQIATLLWRFSGEQVGDRTKFDKFPDKTDVSTWAIPGMIWATDVNVLTGFETSEGYYIRPLYNAQRCEVTTLVDRSWKLLNP